MNDTALYDRLNAVTNKLDELIARLNSGNGTMGQLLTDRQLYENMNKVTMDMSALLQQITKDPKRYLNLKVSLF